MPPLSALTSTAPEREKKRRASDRAVARRTDHALVDALGNPVDLILTPGQAHDLACAEPLIDSADPNALIGDKAYDADPFIDGLIQRGITPVRPPLIFCDPFCCRTDRTRFAYSSPSP